MEKERLERDEALAGLIESGIPLWQQLVDKASVASVGTVFYYYGVRDASRWKMVKTDSNSWTQYDDRGMRITVRGVLGRECHNWDLDVIKDALYTMQYPEKEKVNA
jgi:hypothetical protein